MRETVTVDFRSFFAPKRIEPFFPKALEALLELAFRTNLHFHVEFHQLRLEFNSDVHEGIELWVHWEGELFAAIYLRTSPEPITMMARDYRFDGIPRVDRQLAWATKEEGVAVLAALLEPVVFSRQSHLDQRYRTLQQLRQLHRGVVAVV